MGIKYLYSLLGSLLLGMLYLSPVCAQDANTQKETLEPPTFAKLSPNGGRLEVSQQIKVFKKNDHHMVQFVIPADAENLSISIPGHIISRWSTSPILLESSSEHASIRRQLEETKLDLQSKINTLKARIAVWEAQTQPAAPQELARRQELMAQDMPNLIKEKNKLEEKQKLVTEELDKFPVLSGLGQLIQATLLEDNARESVVHVNYSYDLQNCGWNAVYDFNAHPDDGTGEMVDVRLMAEVWQYTGMDWTNTQITLATMGSGPREPEPLPKWVVGAAPKPEPRAVKLSARAANAHDAAVEELAAEAPQTLSLPVIADTDSIYASWTLASKGLPEGRYRLQIIADAWRAPLQWLARPSQGDNRVWMLAKYRLPQNQAWPDGIAQYSVDGQSIGQGTFRSKGGEATLYFGADPRVTVHTTIDSNKQGETGFINTDKTWTWSWTYTISNEHNKPIKVKVERPSPMIANDNITVAYKDKPESIKDDKEHMVYWEIEVPAHGKNSIEHSITISSPQKLPLLPDVP